MNYKLWSFLILILQKLVKKYFCFFYDYFSLKLKSNFFCVIISIPTVTEEKNLCSIHFPFIYLNV